MRLIPKGTLLFSFKLTIGKMAFAGTDLYTNEAIAALFPKDSSLDTKFLQFSLKFIDPSSGSSHAVKGKTLNRNGLREIRIPLPPLPEQKRIAATLTEKLAAVEQARKASEARLEAARALPAAYLREVFEAKGKTLPQGWRWATLGEVATYINGKAFKPSDWVNNGLRIIRIENLNNPSADYNHFYGEVEEKYLVCNGNLLVSWSASLDAFIWHRGDAVLNQHIFKVIENPEIVNKTYLYFALKEVMQEIRNQTHGATMKHINKPDFESFEIPLPPLPEQKEIAADLTGKFANVEQIKDTATEQSSAIKSLPASLLRQAFSGAL